MEMDISCASLATGNLLLFVSPFVFHRRKSVMGLEWNEAQYIFLNYFFSGWGLWLSEQEFQTRIGEISSVCSADRKGVSHRKETFHWSVPEGGGCRAFRHVFGIPPATFSAKTVTAESRHVNLTSSSVSHLLMLSVDWFSFSSSPCRRDKAIWDRSKMSVAMPATSGKCYSSNPTLICMFSSDVSYTLMTHRCFTLLFSLWEYFLSWVEDEKPVHLAQLAQF